MPLILCDLFTYILIPICDVNLLHPCIKVEIESVNLFNYVAIEARNNTGTDLICLYVHALYMFGYV